MDWFEVFKSGRHTDSAGHTRDWTDADLAHIATSYQPAHHEAPLVLGHPTDDAPAYGWVEALKAQGGRLLAKPRQVAAELKQWVQDGRYKKVSIALYGDGSLRHIGFLGAMPPAVKGLAPAAFADAGRAWTYIEPYQERTIKSLFARLRDWLIEQKGVEAADAIISPYDLEALTVPEVDATAPAYTEPGEGEPRAATREPRAAGPITPADAGGGRAMKEWLAKLQASLTALFAEAEHTLPASGVAGPAPTVQMFSETDVQARERAAADKATKAAEVKAARTAREQAVHTRVILFCDGGIAAGKFLPAWKDRGLPAVIEQALLVETPLQFAEGTDPANPGEILLGIFGELPKMVPFGEVAPARTAAPEGDTAGAKLEVLTQQYLKEHTGATYGVAFGEVQQAQPELAAAYAVEIAPKR